jgi:hypothetical protein
MLQHLATAAGQSVMIDEEIRATFDELRRIGVDLGRPADA